MKMSELNEVFSCRRFRILSETEGNKKVNARRRMKYSANIAVVMLRTDFIRQRSSYFLQPFAIERGF